jgi:hydroxymethylbilane synthase
VFAGYPVRDDPRDALVHPGGLRLADLAPGTRIGTSAVRRVAQLARDFPGLVPVPIRGNANTRLAKLDAGEVDALLLAVSGLERIGQSHRVADVLPVTTMTPAVGAGVLGLQCREGDDATIELVSGISDPVTWRQVTAERIMLHVLQGHCNSPIAGHATAAADGTLTLTGAVFSLDGKQTLTATDTAAPGDAITLGTSVALTLLRQGAHELIAASADPT